jgi:hypothetical protein
MHYQNELDYTKLKSYSQLPTKIRELYPEKDLNQLCEEGRITYYTIYIKDNVRSKRYFFLPEKLKNELNDFILKVPRLKTKIYPIEYSKGGTKKNVPMSIRALKEDLDEYHPYLGSCIYFLIRDNEVVYIGQSTNLTARVGAHKNDKSFDHVYYFRVPPEELDDLERCLIKNLRPEYNRNAVRNNSEDPRDKDFIEQGKVFLEHGFETYKTVKKIHQDHPELRKSIST